MNADRALKVLVQTARNDIRGAADDAMTVVRTGKGAEFHSPFMGKTQEKHVSLELRTVALKLAGHGLDKDAEFLTALEKVVEDAAAKPVFSLFSAFDGEGSFAEDVGYEIHAKNIGPLPSYLHEVLHPINENLLAEKK